MKTAFTILAVLFVSLNLFAASRSQPEWRIQQSEDFFMTRLQTPQPKAKNVAFLAEETLEQCREKIVKSVCWVEPWTPDQKGDRSCLAGSEKYASYFEGHFDRSPDLIKKMYCHIDKIWVEKNFFGTAYANVTEDVNGQFVRSEIGIRQEVLDLALPFDRWLSWKEETSFGGSLKTTDPLQGLISYKSNHPTKEFFLDYVLDHEFGHLFDFANHLNATQGCEYKETSPGKWERIGECKPVPGTWGDLSWETTEKPKPEDDFAFRADICFYRCAGKTIDPKKAASIFADLQDTGFQSTYSTVHPMEDWAEVFALSLAHSLFGLQYSIEIQGQVFDMTAHFNSDKLAKKRDYVQRFLKSDYKYPGPGLSYQAK